MNSKRSTTRKATRIKALRMAKAEVRIPHGRDHISEMHFLIRKEINAARQRLGISEAEFAERLGIDAGHLSQ